MLEDEVGLLRAAFQGRPKPREWVRQDLHPLDLLEATDFVRDVEAGADRATLFQGAIPYFALLTEEARVFLLPDYLATIAEYETHIISAACELAGERAKVVLTSLTAIERAAVKQFIDALFRQKCLKYYAEEICELTRILESNTPSRRPE